MGFKKEAIVIERGLDTRFATSEYKNFWAELGYRPLRTVKVSLNRYLDTLNDDLMMRKLFPKEWGISNGSHDTN